jgi:predicted RNase H-like nuclease (RuvC/YqgF family)
LIKGDIIMARKTIKELGEKIENLEGRIKELQEYIDSQSIAIRMLKCEIALRKEHTITSGQFSAMMITYQRICEAMGALPTLDRLAKRDR